MVLFRSPCLRSMAVHRRSKGTKHTDNPKPSTSSHRVALTCQTSSSLSLELSDDLLFPSRYLQNREGLHARATGGLLEVGVFAQGLSIIVHIQ